MFDQVPPAGDGGDDDATGDAWDQADDERHEQIGPPDDLPELGIPFWVSMQTGEVLEQILTMEPGPNTLLALHAVQMRTLEPADQVLLAVAWEAHAAFCQANMYAAVHDAVTERPGGLPPELMETELGLATRRSDFAVGMLRHFANRVVEQFPVMFGLMKQGRVAPSYAGILDDLTFTLTDEQARAVDEEVSRRAQSLTGPAFRRVVTRTVAQIDPDFRTKRHERAKQKQSGVRIYRQPDGMATVGITMPAPAAVAAVGALNAHADRIRTEGDPRSHGERQVDAFLEGLAAVDAARPADGERVRPSRRRAAEILVFIDLHSLLGLRDDPGELAGYGPIPAAMVRAMLAEEGTVLRRLVVDPATGVLTDYGVNTYEPDETLRRVLAARDVTCRFPGCTRNAVWCDAEHCDPYDRGGPTSCANCGLMCRKHHNHKTHDGFAYSRPDPTTGETLWQTPLGFIYRQGAAFYYRDGRDTGDTTLVKIPTGDRWRERWCGQDDPDPPPEG